MAIVKLKILENNFLHNVMHYNLKSTFDNMGGRETQNQDFYLF